MTSKIRERPLGYKVGLVMIIITHVFVIIGSSLPSWHNFKVVHDDGFENEFKPLSTSYISGLWGRCHTDYTSCTLLGTYPGYVSSVRSIIGIGSFLLFVSLVLALWLNFCQGDNCKQRDNRSIEIVAFVGSVLGLIGCTVYGVLTKQESSSNHIGPAFAVTCVGYIISLTASLIIAVSHRKLQTETKSIAWPYNIPAAGLVDPQESHASGFPVDNPAFVDPTQIRFTRTTRPSNSSDLNASVVSGYSHHSAPPNPYAPRAIRIDQGYYGSESGNRSTDQISEADMPPPSYDSIMSSESSLNDSRGYRGVNYNPQPQQQARQAVFQPRMTGSNEVEL